MRKSTKILILLLSFTNTEFSLAKSAEKADYSEAIAKTNIRYFESKITSECKNRMNACIEAGVNLVYYNAALANYDKVFYYIRRITPSSGTLGGNDQCMTMFQENRKKQIVAINYWGAYYLAKKKLKNETREELMHMLDYAYACHLFDTWNERIAHHNWSPNPEVLTDGQSYVKEAEAVYGAKHAQELLRFRREIISPYFDAYYKLVEKKTGRELTKAHAKTAILAENAYKAAMSGKFPKMFAIQVGQRSNNEKLLLEMFLQNE